MCVTKICIQHFFIFVFLYITGCESVVPCTQSLLVCMCVTVYACGLEKWVLVSTKKMLTINIGNCILGVCTENTNHTIG